MAILCVNSLVLVYTLPQTTCPIRESYFGPTMKEEHLLMFQRRFKDGEIGGTEVKPS